MNRLNRRTLILTFLVGCLLGLPLVSQARSDRTTIPKPVVPWKPIYQIEHAFWGVQGIPGYGFLRIVWTYKSGASGCSYRFCGVGGPYSGYNDTSKPYPNPYIRTP